MKNSSRFFRILFLSFGFFINFAVASTDCFEFFYVKRPVAMGAVIHEFIAMENLEFGASEAFGLLKGTEDLMSFVESRKEGAQTSLESRSLGFACGEKAITAITSARRYSRVWTEYYQNWALYLIRMGSTPVMGKPCRNTALAIAQLVEPYLN